MSSAVATRGDPAPTAIAAHSAGPASPSQAQALAVDVSDTHAAAAAAAAAVGAAASPSSSAATGQSPLAAQASPLANSIPASNEAIHLRVLSPGFEGDSDSDSEDEEERSSRLSHKPSQPGTAGRSGAGTPGRSGTGTPTRRHESPLVRTDTSFAKAFGMPPVLSDRTGGDSTDRSNSIAPPTLLMAHSPPPQTRPRLSASTPGGSGSGATASSSAAGAAAAALLKKPPTSSFELRSPFSPSPVLQTRTLGGAGVGASSASDDDENKFSPSSCVRTLPPHQYVDSFEEERSEPVSVQMTNLTGGQLYIHETPLVQPRNLGGAAQGAIPKGSSSGGHSTRKTASSSPNHSKDQAQAPPNLLVLPQAAPGGHSRSSSSTHSAWGGLPADPRNLPSSNTASAMASPSASPATVSLALPSLITVPATTSSNSAGGSGANGGGGGARGGIGAGSIANLSPPSPMHHALGLRSPGASPEPPSPGVDTGSPLSPDPAPSKSTRTPCLRSFSFAFMIAVVAALVLAAAVVVVGWIGRRAAVDIATDMGALEVDALFVDARRDVSKDFALGLSDLATLATATQDKFRNFHNASTITNTTGWLSVLTSAACLSRQLYGLGIINQRRVGMFATVHQPNSTNFIHGLAGQDLVVVVGSQADAEAPEPAWNLYLPQAIHPPIVSRYSPALLAKAPLDSQEPLADMSRYLGSGMPITFEQVREVAALNLLTGRRMRQENITMYWDEPEPVLPRFDSPFISAFSMRVYSRLEPSWLQPADAATLGDAPLALGMIDLRLFTQSFQEIRLGEHGLAFLLTPNGLVVSSSNLAYNHSTVTDGDGTTVISHVLPILLACRLITNTPVDSLSALDAIDLSERVCEGHFTWGGLGFDMHAQLLDQAATGLPFSMVIVTHPEDFYGARLYAALIQVVWSSCLTLAVGVLLVSLAASFLARPLGSVIRFMSRVRRVAALPSSAHKHSQMQKLLHKWDRQHGYKHQSQVAQSETPRMSSRSRSQSVSHGAESSAPPKRRCCSVQTKEVALIERSFGEFLQTWASYDELEELNHSKRRFIRYIFHEVRVPFNALVLGIEQLQADVSPHHALLGDAMDTLAILHEQTEVVTHILNDVLSLQKIEDGALTLEFQVFCLERMIRATLYSFKAPCQERQLKIKLNLANLNQHMQSKMDAMDLSPGPNSRFEDLKRQAALVTSRSEMRFGIFGDHHRLRQVLSNFASNAIKFSRKAGEDIRVTLFFDSLELTEEFKTSLCDMQARRAMKEKEAAAVPGSAGLAAMDALAAQFDLDSQALLVYFSQNPVATVGVRVTVADKGVGIPEEHLKNLFTPYMQINAGTLQKSKGTGLGLSVSKSIMVLHGGSVACQSIEGQGADFTFSIPCLEVRMMPPSAGGSTVRNSAATTPSTAPSRLQQKPAPFAVPAQSRTSSGAAPSLPAYEPSADSSSGFADSSAAMFGAVTTASSSSTSSFKFPVTHVTRTGMTRRASNTPSRSVPRHLAQQNSMALVTGAPNATTAVVQSAAVVDSDLEAMGTDVSSSPASAPGPSQPGTTRTSTFVVIHSPPTAASHSPLTVSLPLDQSQLPLQLPAPALVQGSWAEGAGAAVQTGSPSPPLVDESKLQLPRRGSATVTGGPDRAVVKRQLSSEDDPAPVSYHPNLSVKTSPQQSTVNLLALSIPTNINILTPTAIHDLQTTAPSSTWPSMRSLSDNASSPSPSSMASSTVHSSTHSRGSGQMTVLSTAASTPVVKAVVRVLVVEDSPPNRKLLCALLHRLGCRVSSAEHGEECVNLLKPIMALSPRPHDYPAVHGPEPGKINMLDQMVPFDIILMDNSMPVMDGVTATRLLRAGGITIPIVGVTGNTLEEDVNAFMAAGATEILAKPVSAAKLEKVLRDYTAYGAGKRAPGASVASRAPAPSSFNYAVASTPNQS